MATHEYERPWQVMPAKIIKLALDHAQKNDDFDHQVAFLLLDIGVEAALKTYLMNRKHDVEKIIFPELLRKVKEELQRTNPDLIHQIDDISYFHGIRNKLYHQGDGVRPTIDNLKRYSELAKKMVEQVIEVSLETEEKKHMIEIKWGRHKFEDLVDTIEKRFQYFQESCAIVTEKVRPAYATREFAMKMNFIAEQWGDHDYDDPEDRIENRKERLAKFNELTGTEQESYGVVHYVLEDINHLYVNIALRQINGEWQHDWNEYTKLYERRSRLIHDWKSGVQSGRLTNNQVREDFEGMISWIEGQQEKLDEWIKSHIGNASRPLPPIDLWSLDLV